MVVAALARLIVGVCMTMIVAALAGGLVRTDMESGDFTVIVSTSLTVTFVFIALPALPRTAMRTDIPHDPCFRLERRYCPLRLLQHLLG